MLPIWYIRINDYEISGVSTQVWKMLGVVHANKLNQLAHCDLQNLKVFVATVFVFEFNLC